MVEVSKGPGYDWAVVYEVDEGRDTMSVFGVLTVEEAIAEARFSLNANIFGSPDFVPPAIVSVSRE